MLQDRSFYIICSCDSLFEENNDKISYLEMDDPDYYCGNRNNHLVFHILSSIYHEVCHVEQCLYINNHHDKRSRVYKINNRLKSTLIGSIAGSFGWVTYLICVQFGNGLVTSTFVGAFVIGLLCEQFARRFKDATVVG